MQAAGLGHAESEEDHVAVVMQGEVVGEVLLPVRACADDEPVSARIGGWSERTHFWTSSARWLSFSTCSSSVQSCQNVTTESAAPETILDSSLLTARAHTWNIYVSVKRGRDEWHTLSH